MTPKTKQLFLFSVRGSRNLAGAKINFVDFVVIVSSNKANRGCDVSFEMMMVDEFFF